MTPSTPRVLLVDDVEDNRDMYAEFLRYSGLEVDVAGDGEAALQHVRRGRPDVIVMDLAMPVMHGWEACRRLKADPSTHAIPVIVLTARVLKGADIEMPPVECEGYLTKPCLPQDLLAEIRRRLPGALVAGASGSRDEASAGAREAPDRGSARRG
ncbi:MAG: response regulator [Candidatus Rokuibacteriota bacterium]